MYALTKSVLLILFCFSLFGCDTGLSTSSAKQQLESYLESEKNPLSDSIKAGAYEFCPAPMLAVNGQKTLTIDTIENGVYKKLKSSGYITTELKRQYGLAPTMYVYDIKETNLIAPLIVDRKKTGLASDNSYLIELQVATIKNFEITGMAKENQNTYLVEFKYNENLNDIGKLIQNTLARPESISKAGVARFLKYDDGWRLKAVETRKISNNNQANFLPIAKDSSEVSYVNVEVTNKNCFPQDFWIDDRPIVAIPANESRTIQATSGLHVTMACGAGSSQVWQYHRDCGGPTEVTWIGDNLKHTINRASNCPSIEPSQTKGQPIKGDFYVMKVNAPKEVNVRSGPGPNFSIVKKVFANDSVSVYRTENGWSYIGDGWVNSNLLIEEIEAGE